MKATFEQNFAYSSKIVEHTLQIHGYHSFSLKVIPFPQQFERRTLKTSASSSILLQGTRQLSTQLIINRFISSLMHFSICFYLKQKLSVNSTVHWPKHQIKPFSYAVEGQIQFGYFYMFCIGLEPKFGLELDFTEKENVSCHFGLVGSLGLFY